MKSVFYFASLLVLSFSSCSGNGVMRSESVVADSVEVSAADSLSGKWLIEDVVVTDSVYVRLADASQFIRFAADSSYFIATNCNSISGTYVRSGDSIRFNDGFCTEMACDNMQLEDLIKRVLPGVNAVDFVSDSICRLNTSGGMYIVLRKALTE